MKKILLFATLFFLVPVFGYAQNSKSVSEETEDVQWRANFKRIALELSNTSVSNASEYADSPNAQLSADSESMIKGVFDGAIERETANSLWSNSLFMEYGETKLKPEGGGATSSENADDILLSSNLEYECWEFGGFKFGPTIRAAYDTEFVASEDAPRQNLVRANAGLSLFDNKIVKSLYLTGVYEYDFTYADNKISKTAAEVGWRLEYEIRDGVKFSSNGYYREYLGYSSYEKTDLERDLSAVARLDTNLWGDLTLGPYVQYRRARARGVDVYGSNFIVGISFNYITKFGLID